LSIKLTEKTDLPLGAEPQRIPGLELFGRLHKGPPARPVQPPVQGGLDRGFVAPAAYSTAGQPRRDDLAVIDHQAVAGPQEIRQVANAAVGQFGRLAGFHHQQPGTVARDCGPQGNAVRRQVEIEEVGLHAFLLSRPSKSSAL
jgi:hypothetical protein